MNKLITFISGLALSVSVMAAEWYVDAANGNDLTGDGSSAAPFATIQKAIDSASKTVTDTIWVRPGVYKEGTRLGLDSTQQTRVVIDRKVNLYSTEGREVTTILGSYGSIDRYGNSYDGENGTNAQIAYSQNSVACILVDTDGQGSVIRGFTLRDGVTHQSRANGYAAGGICYRSPRFGNDDFTVAFCDFVNCAGRAAGGMHGGTAVGCRFRKCWNLNTAGFGTAVYRASIYNCILDGNGYRGASNYAIQDPGLVVNCTLVNNYNRNGFNTQVTGEGRGCYYNVACYDNCTTNGDLNATAVNCVFDQDISLFASGSERVTSFDQSNAVKTNLCVCPLTGDFRPVAGGLLDGTGDTTYLALIPESYRNLDFNGKAREDAQIPIGAFLASATVASGALKLSGSRFSVNGLDAATYPVYVQSAIWPSEVELGKSSQQSYYFAGITLPDAYRSKGQYESVWQLIPPRTDVKGAVAPIEVKMQKYSSDTPIYVGGDNAVDASDSGTADKPFATIQAAVESFGTGSSNFRIVKVRPGHYRTGVTVDTYGQRARLAIPKKKYVHIMAEGSAADTFIHGAPDPETGGFGTNAVRCIGAPSESTFIISGFTICDSYSTNGTQNVGSAMRGTGRGTDSNQKVYDCVFTGNHGYACCGNQSVFVRCVFTNNVCENGSVLLNSYAAGCVFANNSSTGKGNMPFSGSTHGYNCTVYEPNATSANATYNTDTRQINNIFLNCASTKNHTTGGVVAGCVHYNVLSDSLTDSYNTKANPLIGAAWGDFRPLADSPALTAGVAEDATGVSTTTLMSYYLSCDLYNRPVISDDGEVCSGALAAVREKRTVYADAENGDDDADGLTESTAKKSLKAAVSTPCDGTVIALPGRYDQETMAMSGSAVHGGTPSLKCRVIVPAETTLLAKYGPASTFIVGEADPDATQDPKGMGRGPDAVRCVFLEKGATVSGFTIQDGHTSAEDSSYVDDAFGGGVMGRSIAGTLVENCIVTGNVAACGGAGAYTTFRNCRLLNNTAWHFGGIARHVSLYGCYVAGNLGSNPLDVYTDVINCTFGDGNLNPGGTAAHFLNNGGASSRVWNCVNFSPVSNDKMTQSKPDYRNCFFPSEAKYNLGSNTQNVSFAYTRAELLQMFADGVPCSGAAVIDAGTNDALDLLPDTDIAGNQRVYNGVIDIGAYEYDWRADYAQTLGRRVTVKEASGTMKQENGKVVFHSGDTMTVEWSAGGKTDVPYRIKAVLNGTGVLTVTDGSGSVVATFTSSGVRDFSSGLDVTTLRFDYVSSDGGTAYVDRLNRAIGLTVLLR